MYEHVCAPAPPKLPVMQYRNIDGWECQVRLGKKWKELQKQKHPGSTHMCLLARSPYLVLFQQLLYLHQRISGTQYNTKPFTANFLILEMFYTSLRYGLYNPLEIIWL